jgi:uncharacterized repeat protein (TIGR03803 family)
VIFSEPLTGGTPNILYSFDGTHGSFPLGSLTLIGSTLYGMTGKGGASNDGVIFSMPLTGGTLTVLATFNGTNGANPHGNLTLYGSTLYGMTVSGGTNGDGTAFALLLPEPSSVILLGIGAVAFVAMAARRRMRRQAA